MLEIKDEDDEDLIIDTQWHLQIIATMMNDMNSATGL